MLSGRMGGRLVWKSGKRMSERLLGRMVSQGFGKRHELIVG
jgi:hypothetical protein